MCNAIAFVLVFLGGVFFGILSGMSKQDYPKDFLTIEQQIEKLLPCFSSTEESALEEKLKNINYYKLGLYIHPFKDQENIGSLVSGVSLDHVMSLYNFDKKLRLVLLDAIETIETTMAVKLAYNIGEKDKFFFYKERDNNLVITGKENLWLELHEEIQNFLDQKRGSFYVKRSYKKYNQLPVWIIIETLTMGQLGNLFDCVDGKISREVLKGFGFLISQEKIYTDWWKDLNGLRNKCAHHDLVYNNKFPPIKQKYKNQYEDVFMELPELESIEKLDNFSNTLYSRVVMIWFILKRINPNSNWNKRLYELITSFPADLPNDLNINNMGFPNEWHSEDFWNLS